MPFGGICSLIIRFHSYSGPGGINDNWSFLNRLGITLLITWMIWIHLKVITLETSDDEHVRSAWRFLKTGRYLTLSKMVIHSGAACWRWNLQWVLPMKIWKFILSTTTRQLNNKCSSHEIKSPKLEKSM